jgi:hypothetical protein
MGSKVNSYLTPNIIARLEPLSIDSIEACGWFVKESFFCIINPIKMKAKVPNLSPVPWTLYRPLFLPSCVSCFRNISWWRKLASNLALMNFQQICLSENSL